MSDRSSASSDQAASTAFAEEPTIVVGVGRFGLAVLEQLGRSWSRVRDASDDPCLGNLRLLHVSGEADTDPVWRDKDRQAQHLADEIAEGDAPVRALDFLILRSIGLVRFHRGMYQIALPRDYGVPHEEEAGTRGRARRTERLRTFDWIDLDHDVERAPERLRLAIAHAPDLDLFVTPFLERVRAGLSPRIVAEALVRASKYAQGKDPSPWPQVSEPELEGAELETADRSSWLRRTIAAGARATRNAIARSLLAVGAELEELVRRRLEPTSSLAELEVDEDALIDGIGVAEHDHLVGQSSDPGALVSPSLASRLILSGDLARHVDMEHAVVGVGRTAAFTFHEQDAQRARFRRLLGDKLAVSRTLLGARIPLRRLVLDLAAAAARETDTSTASTLEAFGPVLADAWGALDRAEDVVICLEALRSDQEKKLAPNHADVLGTLRATIELRRVALTVALDIVAALERSAVEERRAAIPATIAKNLEDCERRGEFLAGAARHLGELLVERLDQVRAPADPELLAARLQCAEVSAEGLPLGERQANATNAHERSERWQLEEIVRATERTDGDDASITPLAISRRLVALHRLARYHERRGELDEAIAALTKLLEIPPDAIHREHRPTALAHHIVASHSLGRLLLGRTRAATRRGDAKDKNTPGDSTGQAKRAREVLEAANALATSASSDKPVDAPSRREEGAVPVGPSLTWSDLRLAPEHRSVIAHHRLLIEQEIAAVLLFLDETKSAIEALRKALERRQSELGWEHADTLAAAIDLAAAYRRHGDSEQAERILAAVRAGHAPGSIFDPFVHNDDAFDPRDLLGVPWETQGWDFDSFRYPVVGLSTWVHGLYDALDDDGPRQLEFEMAMRPKLERLGRLCYRGLLELFWELRNRERPPVADDVGRTDEEVQSSLARSQSTDLIAEVLFRGSWAQPTAPTLPVDVKVEAHALPEVASALLHGLEAPVHRSVDDRILKLDARLAELGAIPPRARSTRDPIFSHSRILRSASNNDPQRPLSWRHLHQTLREIVARLIDVSFLTRTSERSVGRPPRVQIFVVGDLGEPFLRASLEELLTVMHAELLRTFRAVFKEFRGGFARNLSIVPVLWYPNAGFSEPKQAREAKHYVVAARHEEAAVQDALLRLRRHIFRLPNHERFVPMVYLCSRVNDAGVVSLRESVLQTHDFLSMCTRSAMGADDWLRLMMIGPHGRDPFGTFGCIELDLPMDRVREYLASRLARLTLGELLHAKTGEEAPDPTEAAEREALERPLVEATEAANKQLEGECGGLARRASAGLGEHDDDPDAVLGAYSGGRAQSVAQTIQSGWAPIVAQGCTMDRNMDELRRAAKTVTQEGVAHLRERSDAVIADVTRGHPLAGPLRRLENSAAAERARLTEATQEMTSAQQAAFEEQLPKPEERMKRAFEAVRAEAERVPRVPPIELAHVVLAPFALAASSVLAIALSLKLELNRSPGVLEFVLVRVVPWAGVVGALALFRWLLARYRQSSLDAMNDAMVAAKAEAEAIVVARTDSIQSFLQKRVDYLMSAVQRGVAGRCDEQARLDVAHGRRLRLAAEHAERDMRRHSEALGVRTTGDATFDSPPQDEFRELLYPPGREHVALLEGDSVLGYFTDTLGPPAAQRALVPLLTERAAPDGRWRDGVWFSSRSDLLGPGRARFSALLSPDIFAHPRFRAAIEERVRVVTEQSAAQLGLPGYVQGAEGLDDDGVLFLAASDLVMPPELAKMLPRIRSDIEVRVAPVRRNAGYLLTLVQGMDPQLPLIHRRHLSFHENTSVARNEGEQPMHLFTGMKAQINSIHERFQAKKP